MTQKREKNRPNPAPFGPATDRVKKEKKTDMTGNTIPSTALLLLGPGGSQNWLPQASADRPLLKKSVTCSFPNICVQIYRIECGISRT
jgi:hypothetical protein